MDDFAKVIATFNHWWQSVVMAVDANDWLQLLVVVAIGALLIVVVHYYTQRLDNRGTKITRRSWWRSVAEINPMTRRDKREKQLMADMLTDGLENMVVSDQLSMDRAKVWYRKFAVQHGLTDMMPKRFTIIPDPEAVKNEIRKQQAMRDQQQKAEKRALKKLIEAEERARNEPTKKSGLVTRVFGGRRNKAA